MHKIKNGSIYYSSSMKQCYLILSSNNIDGISTVLKCTPVSAKNAVSLKKKHFAKFITLEREIYCVDCRKPFLISNKCFSALRHKPKNEKISSEIIKYFSSLLLVKTPEISDKQLKSKKRKVDNSTIHLTPYCSDRYYDRFNYVPSKTIKYYGTNP